MPSVFQRPGSPFWYAAYRGARGQREKKALPLRVGIAPKKAAEAAAATLERAAKQAREGRFTEARFRKLISELSEDAAGAPVVFYSVEDWLRDWLAGKASTTARTTFLAYRNAVAEFLRHLGPERAAGSLERVTPKDVLAFRDGQVAQGKTPQTANNLLKAIRLPFSVAHSQGYIPTDPTAANVVPTLPKQTAKRDLFTAPQITALLAAAEGDWQGAILAGFYTGQRLRDVANLRWEGVKLDAPIPHIVFVQRKTGRTVPCPLRAELADWLRTRRREAPAIGKAPLFPSLAGRGTGGKYGLSGRFKAIMERAGIVSALARERSKAKGSKGRSLSALSFHGLRHTFNSFLANAEVPQELRQELTGHASAEMNRVYTQTELARLRTALDSLPPLPAAAVGE